MSSRVEKSLIGATLAAALLGMAPMAQADIVTLSNAQLDAFTLSTGNVNLGSWSIGTFPPNGSQIGAMFGSACLDEGTAGTCKAVFELTGQSIAFGASDTFAIDVYNSNASPWVFTLTIVDTLDHQLTTSSIVVGTQQTMSIASNDTVNPIQTVLISVSDGPTNLGNHDAIANFNMYTTQVPEPFTLALLAVGMLGLGFARRRTLS